MSALLDSPRILPFVTIKRDIARFRDTYGHWWIELDASESYGWWATRCPLRLRDVLLGTCGCVNGVGSTITTGTATSDPRHGEDADFSFHPLLLVDKTDDEVRAEIRTIARHYDAPWGWPWWWLRHRMTNCHTFQLDVFEAVGLTEGDALHYTRGPGCPVMLLVRRLRWRAQDALAAAGRLRGGSWRALVAGPRGEACRREATRCGNYRVLVYWRRAARAVLLSGLSAHHGRHDVHDA